MNVTDAAFCQAESLQKGFKRKSMLRWAFFKVLLAAVILSTQPYDVCAATVVIKTSPRSRTDSDVYLRESKGKSTKLLTIPEVYRGHYHPAEYHNGCLYIIRRRPGGDFAYKKNPQWSDELWRYTKDGAGTKLWSSRGLDFRVSDNSELIAILSHSKQDSRNALQLLTTDGKSVRSYSSKALVVGDVQFEKWTGQYLWLKDQEETEINGFVRIDTRTMNIRKFDLSGLELQEEDYALNTVSLELAYSDYPVMVEVDTADKFAAQKIPVTLLVYNLEEKRSREVARSIAKPFRPRWIDATTLEYNKPNGRGRDRTRIY